MPGPQARRAGLFGWLAVPPGACCRFRCLLPLVAEEHNGGEALMLEGACDLSLPGGVGWFSLRRQRG